MHQLASSEVCMVLKDVFFIVRQFVAFQSLSFINTKATLWAWHCICWMRGWSTWHLLSESPRHIYVFAARLIAWWVDVCIASCARDKALITQAGTQTFQL